jgi:WD40 repeat protein
MLSLTAHAQPAPDDLWTQDAGEPVFRVDFSPDGSLVASGNDEPIAHLWNASDGSLDEQFPGYTYDFLGLEFSPAGTYLAAGTIKVQSGYPSLPAGRTDLWNYETGERVDTFWGGFNGFSADGAYLMTAGGGVINDINIHRVSDGAEIRSIYAGVVIRSAAISPDGDFVAAGDPDGLVRIWRVANGALVDTLTHDSSSVRVLAYSPDGTLLASAGYSDHVKLWDTTTGQIVRTLNHGGTVHSLDFTDNGTFMLSTGYTNAVGQTIRFWEVATGELLATLEPGIPWVYGAAWSPDGGTFVYGLSDGTVAVAVSPVSMDLPGDWNGDNRIDLVDYGPFFDCFAGPGTLPDPVNTDVATCLSVFDFNGDDDVDLGDFSDFQRAFTN